MIKSLFTKKSSSGKTVAFMGFSSIFNSVLMMSSGILVARWLLPESLGLFNSFNIITSYIILIQAGVPSGLSRELPFYMGRNEVAKAEAMAAVSNYWGLMLGGACLILGVIGAIYFLIVQNFEYAAGSFVVGITSFQALYVTKYIKVLYRSNNDFNKLSAIEIIDAVTAFGSVYFVWKFGFYGLCVRAVLLVIVDLYFAFRWRPLKVKPKWDKPSFVHIMKVGMPIYWVANVYALMPIFQRTAILSLGGTKSLGLFTLSVVVDNAMGILKNAISSNSFPKMAAAWAKGASFMKLLRIPLKLVIFSILISAVLAAAGWYIMPYFVQKFFPNYLEGVPAAQWTLVAGCVGYILIFSNVYMIIQKNVDRLIAFISGIVGWLISLFVLNHVIGYSLIIFPISMMVAYIFIFMVDILNFKRYAKSVEPLPFEEAPVESVPYDEEEIK